VKRLTAPPPEEHSPFADDPRVYWVEEARRAPADDPVATSITRVERLVFRSDLLAIASFRCPPSDPIFVRPDPIHNAVFAFPRTDVRIQHEGSPAFLSGPNLVTFYNRGDVFRRFPVGGAWDDCEWYWIEPGALAEVVARRDPAAADRPGPFRFSWGPSDPRAYLEQRRAFLHAMTAEAPDRLYLEETMLWVLDRILRCAVEAHPPEAAGRGAARLRQADLVEAAKDLLASRAREPLDLTELARALSCSPFHLCRVFRRRTGFTLSEYQHQLRLRHSLERVADRHVRLTDLALELGYASHSHFTLFFRRAFGVTPIALRSRWMGVPVRLDPLLS
jgi:AraC-like DNA-binding protein